MSLRHSPSRHSPMKLLDGARVVVREVRNTGMAESLVLANDGDADQPLTGWALASLNCARVFRFDDGIVLRAGGSLTVTSGEGVAHRPPQVLGWTDQPVWNNRGDIALLFDCDGDEVTRYAYPASMAAQAARLPRHRLVRSPEGSDAIEALPRGAKRARGKVSRPRAART